MGVKYIGWSGAKQDMGQDGTRGGIRHGGKTKQELFGKGACHGYFLFHDTFCTAGAKREKLFRGRTTKKIPTISAVTNRYGVSCGGWKLSQNAMTGKFCSRIQHSNHITYLQG